MNKYLINVFHLAKAVEYSTCRIDVPDNTLFQNERDEY